MSVSGPIATDQRREVYIFHFSFFYFSSQELPTPFPGPRAARGRGSHFPSPFPISLPLPRRLQSSLYIDELRKGGISTLPLTGVFHLIYAIAVVMHDNNSNNGKTVKVTAILILKLLLPLVVVGW